MQKPLKYTQTVGVAAAVGIASIIDATLVTAGAAIVGVDFVVVQAETQACRWADDGTVPTATVGHVLQAGQSLIVYRGQFATFKVIQAAATATLNATAYKGDAFPILPPGAAGSAGGGAGAGGPVTAVDGGLVTVGANADAAAAVGGTGTLSAKLRTLTNNFPTPAALSDALGNPTATMVGMCVLLWDGTQFVRVRQPATFKDENAVAVGSIVTVWTPAGGKKFRLMGGVVSLSAAASLLFEDNAAAAFVFRTPKLAADTPYNFDIPGGRLSAAANNVLKATASAAANMTGTLWGTEE